MSPRPQLARRLPMALAAGALAVATAVTPALAADDPGQSNQNNQSSQGNWSQQSGNGNGNSNNNSGSGHSSGNDGGSGNNTGSGSHQQSGNSQQGGGNQQSGGNGGWGNQAGGNHGDQGEYRGVVTTQKLALRSAPNRGSQVIRYAHKGEVVSIFCKVPGDKVDGNPLWYLLTDGTWAWGPARHIDNIGPAPRWC
ncbi:SH3 domain-containing protein [Streptomyces sp. NPDC086843]|uniref:SH3 domain-containing protein n=1 Tax=Streptomyces sp. NPDC086843 TaxID=3365763 RepID=UPI003819CA7D